MEGERKLSTVRRKKKDTSPKLCTKAPKHPMIAQSSNKTFQAATNIETDCAAGARRSAGGTVAAFPLCLLAERTVANRMCSHRATENEYDPSSSTIAGQPKQECAIAARSAPPFSFTCGGNAGSPAGSRRGRKACRMNCRAHGPPYRSGAACRRTRGARDRGPVPPRRAAAQAS